MKIVRTSPFTGATRHMNIDITPQQLFAWESGELIQNAMPNISAEEREFIMTGISPTEWQDSFGSEEK